jgi:DNA-binding transcriptional LysR family regulator
LSVLSSDGLEAFIAFAERLNFTHAAADLHISQPALHVKIGKLAESVGAPLYRRIGRRLELTAQGVAVLAFARESRERDRLLVETVRTGASHPPITLAAGEGAYLYLLGAAIRAFARRSKSRLTLLQRDQSGTIAAVRSGEAHVGVAILDGAVDGIDQQRIGRWPQVLVMPARHALARKRSLKLADLDGVALVVPPEGRPQRATLQQAFNSASVPWRVAVEATGWALMLHFVEIGVGLAVVNGCCRIPRGLVARPLAELPQVEYHVLARAGAALAGEAAALRRAIVDAATH